MRVGLRGDSFVCTAQRLASLEYGVPLGAHENLRELERACLPRGDPLVEVCAHLLHGFAAFPGDPDARLTPAEGAGRDGVRQPVPNDYRQASTGPRVRLDVDVFPRLSGTAKRC